MKYQNIKLPTIPEWGAVHTERGGKVELYPQQYRLALNDAFIRGAKAAIKPYAKRIAELEAARIAYASEFAPDEDGNPDVGSIHENIRKLKAALQSNREVMVSYEVVADVAIKLLGAEQYERFMVEIDHALLARYGNTKQEK